MPKKQIEEDDEDELEITDRDFVMARVAAARAALSDAITMLDEFQSLCINPDNDKRGKQRKEYLDDALEAVGLGTRSLELAHENVTEMDFAEGEPGDVEEDEDDDDEEDDEDDEDED